VFAAPRVSAQLAPGPRPPRGRPEARAASAAAPPCPGGRRSSWSSRRACPPRRRTTPRRRPRENARCQGGRELQHARRDDGVAEAQPPLPACCAWMPSARPAERGLGAPTGIGRCRRTARAEWLVPADARPEGLHGRHEVPTRRWRGQAPERMWSPRASACGPGPWAGA